MLKVKLIAIIPAYWSKWCVIVCDYYAETDAMAYSIAINEGHRRLIAHYDLDNAIYIAIAFSSHYLLEKIYLLWPSQVQNCNFRLRLRKGNSWNLAIAMEIIQLRWHRYHTAIAIPTSIFMLWESFLWWHMAAVDNYQMSQELQLHFLTNRSTVWMYLIVRAASHFRYLTLERQRLGHYNQCYIL